MVKKEIFGFDVFDKLLKKSMSEIKTSEIHGIIVASICVNKSQYDLGLFCSEFLGIKQNKKIVLNFINHLYYYNKSQIQNLNNIIFLMIPSEKEKLTIKIKHLKTWIKGFISGLGLFGLTNQQCSIPIIYEIINDFSMITRAEDFERQKDQIYYINLLEYVKISVEIIYFEIQKFKNT